MEALFTTIGLTPVDYTDNSSKSITTANCDRRILSDQGFEVIYEESESFFSHLRTQLSNRRRRKSKESKRHLRSISNRTNNNSNSVDINKVSQAIQQEFRRNVRLLSLTRSFSSLYKIQRSPFRIRKMTHWFSKSKLERIGAVNLMITS